MDIEQLISSVDQLYRQDKEINQKIVSQKRALDNIEQEILKEKQRLEEKVKELTKIVENRQKESEQIDKDLSNKSSLLTRMQKTSKIDANILGQSELKESTASLIRANLRKDESENEFVKTDRGNLKANSIEDFLKMQFQKEFQVEYPQTDNHYLDKRSFEKVKSILKDRMSNSKDPGKIANEYLSTYQKSVNDEQKKQILELKNQFNRL